MKTVLHTAGSRGHASFGWLNSYHSFSFGSYHDAERIHFGALRVLNDDTVAAGRGFSTHSHDNMEIVSIPLSGDLHHTDSTGRSEIIRQGDVQIMSAGSGIAHSEMNANRDKEVKFLQLWILPKEKNIVPRYEQKTFDPTGRQNQVRTVVAPDDANAVAINQDAWLSLVNLPAGKPTTYSLHREGNGVYAFILSGSISINGQDLQARDGYGMWDTQSITIEPAADAEIVLIEVPMQIQGA